MKEFVFDQESRKIIDRIRTVFDTKVKGRLPDVSGYNSGHDGREGHWLEKEMGLPINNKNAPDFQGFEMKANTGQRTTFGDWSADYYIFKDEGINISRNAFLRLFGKPNKKKNGRCSWSGSVCPKIGVWNLFGQRLKIDDMNNISAVYSYALDQRDNKVDIVPADFQEAEFELARWNGRSIRTKLERKFNKKGWFKCVKDSSGVYSTISFGAPIMFSFWIESVRRGDVFFDSGMYEGNPRNYSQWRASNSFWESLVIEKYD